MTLTPAIILDLLIKYGPLAVAQAEQLVEWIKAGKQEVTPDDFANLRALGQRAGADYFGANAPAPIATPAPVPAAP